jgi:tRNA(Ile)-lysidine synthase
LNQRRTTLESFAKEHKIAYREDASNASTDILRNRVRHNLLPLLIRDFQPALHQTVTRTMELSRAEMEFGRQSAREWLQGTKSNRSKARPFKTLAVALQRRILLEQLYALGVTPNFELVENLRLRPGTLLNVPQFRPQLLLQPSGILITRKAVPTEFDSHKAEVNLGKPGKLKTFGGLSLEWKHVRARPTARISQRPNFERFDAERIGRRVTLRHWQPGDRFQPIGMPAPVKLQDLFVNARIPRTQRSGLVLATTAWGEIFWVQGLRIGESFKLTPATKKELQWSWRELKPQTVV